MSQPSDTTLTQPYWIVETPGELWLEIFCHVLKNKPFFPSHQSGVHILSRVCRLWRDIVISTPTFWTTINLFNNRVEMGKRERQEKLVDLCLKRSGVCKLNVILTDLQRNQRPEISSTHSLTLPISFLDQSDRWGSLRLEIATGVGTLERFSSIKGHLKNLESCTIIYKQRKKSSFTMHEPIDFLEDAPKLRTLRLTAPADFLPAKVPFSQLTEVDLVPDLNSPRFTPTIDESLDVLERCPNLHRCRLTCTRLLCTDEFFSRRIVTHPNICELDIIEHRPELPIVHLRHGATIFDFLQLPKLTSLSLISFETRPTSHIQVVHDSLDNFLARTGRRLLRLELRFPYQQPNLTQHLKHLRLTPKLQCLFILVAYSQDILQGLSESDGSLTLSLPAALHGLYYWTMKMDSTFAISSTPYWKSPSSYLHRSSVVQEGST
ncbi:hypothetical protein BYT27DRAFT_7192923 [Phlegmacium glaucopus]|nr:hypothetical protein BYT27DRAFT_7192923 [Phlegmacium glaucopus]